MEPYDQNTRRNLAEERIQQLARDYQNAPRDGREQRGRLDPRNLFRIARYRIARNAQPARS